MDKYLLTEEKKRIEHLYNTIQKNLYKQTSTDIKDTLYNIILNNKDSSIEDILNYYTDLLEIKMRPLLDNHLTKGLQYGIKNNCFQIETYGGTYITNNKEKNINESTLFSFDSISKLITSIITMQEIRKNNFNLNTTITTIDNSYQLDATIESILKFTACVKTEKRIDNLSKEETISILKKCKEDLETQKNNNQYYQYSDIGYMILRQTIPNFINNLDKLLLEIDPNNLTYKPEKQKENITGGKIYQEYLTPDPKGKDILFPGHTGLYGNISGLLNLFDSLINTDTILTKEEKEILLKQPYINPMIYNKEKNKYQYTNKIAGLFKIPNGITTNYDKLSSFDIANQTTKHATASSGTCGSWVTSDNLKTNNLFGPYTAGILTNPYTFVENKPYPNTKNTLSNTPLEVNQKGVIIGYSKELNHYKENLTNYAILLELITQYLNLNNNQEINRKKLKKMI